VRPRRAARQAAAAPPAPPAAAAAGRACAPSSARPRRSPPARSPGPSGASELVRHHCVERYASGGGESIGEHRGAPAGSPSPRHKARTAAGPAAAPGALARAPHAGAGHKRWRQRQAPAPDSLCSGERHAAPAAAPVATASQLQSLSGFSVGWVGSWCAWGGGGRGDGVGREGRAPGAALGRRQCSSPGGCRRPARARGQGRCPGRQWCQTALNCSNEGAVGTVSHNQARVLSYANLGVPEAGVVRHATGLARAVSTSSR
jgi:hypothetical protein